MSHSINICFSTTDSLVSRMIRWLTRSTVSHCYITFQDPTLARVLIMEVDWDGFVLKPWCTQSLNGRTLVARFSLVIDEHKQLEAIHRLALKLGARYGFFRLLPLIVRRFISSFRRTIGGEHRLICSESVVMFINECGIDSLASPSSWTPEDVYSYVRNHPSLFVLEE